MKIEVEKKAIFSGHKDCIYTLAAGKKGQFFSSGGDGYVVEWNEDHPDEGTLVAKSESSVYSILPLPGEEKLLFGQNYKGINLIDLKEKREIKSIAITKKAIFDIALVNDKILAATGDGEVVILSKADLTTIGRLKFSDSSARCIAISGKINEFAVGYSDHHIRIFDLNTFELKYDFLAHKNSVFSLLYSPDSEFLLSGSRDAQLKIWKVYNNYELNESIVAHMYAINHIAYSPDFQYFVTGSMDKTIKVWDAVEFKLLKVIDKGRHAGHLTSVNKLLWSDYKGNIISCSDDRSIALWHLHFLP